MNNLDFVLALLTFLLLVLGFVMGLAVFVPRRFERIDTAFVTDQEFLTSTEGEAASGLAEAYNRLVETNDRVLQKMFLYLTIGMISILAGLILISVQGTLLLAEKIQ